MKVIATTVKRHSVVGEQASGRVIEIDWSRQRMVRQFDVPEPRYPFSNTNPRGGVRGGRGVKVWGGKYYVANYDTVFVYDPDWCLQAEISHPLATDIHEIDLDETGVWLSCSRFDLALKLGYNGEKLEHWHVSDSPQLMQEIGIRCTLPDLTRDYRQHLPAGLDHTHLNCVQIGPGESLIVNLGQVRPPALTGRIGHRLLAPLARRPRGPGPAIRRLYGRLGGARSYIVKVDRANAGRTTVLSQQPALRPNHNGQLLSDGVCALAREDGVLAIHHVESQRQRRVAVPGKWLRGLAKIDERRLLVGIEPCGIVEVDLAACRIVRQMDLVGEPHESVHGLALIP